MEIVRLIALAFIGLLGCGENEEPPNCAILDCPPNAKLDMGICACVPLEEEEGDPPLIDPCVQCTVDQICEEAVCVDKPEGWVNPDDLVGLTFAFMCIFDGNVYVPGIGGGAPPGSIQCANTPPIGFTILETENQGKTLRVEGITLTMEGDFDSQASSLFHLPSADFSANPLMDIQAENVVELRIEDTVLSIHGLQIKGVIQPDLAKLTDGVFWGMIDPTPLEAILGSPPCELIPSNCNEEGFMTLYVENLEAVVIDMEIPVE